MANAIIGQAVQITTRNIPGFKKWIGARAEPANWRKNGSRGLPIALDFTAASSYDGAIATGDDSANVAGLSDVQSVYVDNRNNNQPVIFTIKNSPIQQSIIAPAFSQGLYPILMLGSTIEFNATSTGSALVRSFWMNIDFAYNVWNAALPAQGSIIISGAVVSTLVQGAWTDRSAVAGAGSTLVMAANGARKNFQLRNPSSGPAQGIAAPESVFINFTGAAVVNGASSWELLPGESLFAQASVSTEAINFAAATVGHVLIAKEM